MAALMDPTVQELQSIINDAIRALGPAWMHGDASLADGIRRKTAAMERLAAQKQRPPISERPRGSPHATRDVR